MTASGLGHGLFEHVTAPGGKHNIGTLALKGDSGGPTQPRRGAYHQDLASFYCVHWPLPSASASHCCHRGPSLSAASAPSDP